MARTRRATEHRRFVITITNSFAVSGDGFLSEKQAADYYGLSPRTLRNWRSLGVGPAFVRIGGAVRYRRASLDRYAGEQGGAA